MSDNYSVELPAGYECVQINDIVDDCITLRPAVSSAAEWKLWLEKFEVTSQQKFIVQKTYSEPIRLVNDIQFLFSCYN